MSFNQILKVIDENIGKRFVLGIDGLSRSGKTTLVKQLEQKLKQKGASFYMFHMDDHIVERNKRYHTKFEEWYEYYYLQWDIEWLRYHFFQQLKRKEQFRLPFYNDKTDSCKMRDIKIPIPCTIIIEGIFLQRKEWREYFDYIIYLDCPREKRFAREHESVRKNISKFKNRYWKAEDHYLETELPKQRAHFIMSE
ncbi:kinase [Bacillus cytotoxicus]|uniref:kinase n=1 Tax=Bacillus cereus group sp. BfR-BA-01492 TaxID=2920361 RepID=UPI001F563876|nr:kinase [Bacillus cereus group sp. BfR-BA-01492]EMA6342846.1 hypothetical protein [Bacillus cytotoxicus]